MVVIPACNEARTVAEIVRELRSEHGLEVVVIDDLSTDATRECARAAGATVLPLSVRLGAWGATQVGLRYARRKGCDFAVTMDADGQHLASYVPALLAPLRAGRADVVIGACTERGSRARRWAWSYFRTLAGFAVEDITSGFRAYDRRAMVILASAEGTLLDYQDVGVLFLLRRAGSRILEVPVPMAERRVGHSRIFHTWFSVSRYMFETTVLCLAKVGKGRRRDWKNDDEGPH